MFFIRTRVRHVFLKAPVVEFCGALSCMCDCQKEMLLLQVLGQQGFCWRCCKTSQKLVGISLTCAMCVDVGEVVTHKACLLAVARTPQIQVG